MTAAVPARVVVLGAGFCGLAAAYELGRRGAHVTVLERDAEIGGLAGGFDVGGERLEKFYHHWFASDVDILQLIRELGVPDRVLLRRTRTGVYHAHDFFKLSTPLDLLRFAPLSMPNRVRLGLFALWARRVRDWRRLEEVTAADWLRTSGRRARLPSDVGTAAARQVRRSLRGGGRSVVLEQAQAARRQPRQGRGRAARLLPRRVRGAGRHAGRRHRSARRGDPPRSARYRAARGRTDRTGRRDAGWRSEGRRRHRNAGAAHRRRFGACTRPRLRRAPAPHPLPSQCLRGAGTRWQPLGHLLAERQRPDLSVRRRHRAHQFRTASSYAGRHIVYLSRYLPPEDPFYSMAEDEAAAFALRHLRRMFPALASDNVCAAHVWRARYAQPVVERSYRRLIPAVRTPFDNLYLANMAQIYPQDRGTNYAVRQGRAAARHAVDYLSEGLKGVNY